MRTVLCLDQFGEIDAATGAQVLVLKADLSPFEIPEARTFRRFLLPTGDLPSLRAPNGVIEHGKRVKAALDGHPGVKSVLDQVFTAGPDQVRPIFIKLNSGDAEALTWETLCDGKGRFVALDRRWPIGRISVPTTGYGRRAAVFEEPVRILAVISAFGIAQQVKEWRHLYREARDLRAQGLTIRLRVLCADAETRKAVDDACQVDGSWIEVGAIGQSSQQILQEISKWSPNLLHFFCHGVSRDDYQYLELARASDYLDDQAKAGSVRIPAGQLADLAGQLANPWLITLNCCSGGQAAGELQSMAHQVVAAGFPAAIAMLEPVEAADVHEFTRAFYGSLFAKLNRVRQALVASQRVPFEWAEPLYDARTAISSLHADVGPENSPEWALPLLYVNGIEPMQFERPQPPPGGAPSSPATPAAPESVNAALEEFKLRAKVIAEWLAMIKATMSPEQRSSVLEKALAGVPKEYWPTVEGTFSHA